MNDPLPPRRGKAKFRRLVPVFDHLEDRVVPTNYLQFNPYPNMSFSGDESAGSVTITVELTRNDSETVTVDYATSDGTATAGDDYTSTSGTLTFGPTETSKTFDVTILQDSLDEEDVETVNLTLSNPTNAEITSGSTTLDINDDDEMPDVYFVSELYTVKESAGLVTATIELSAASGRTVTVWYETQTVFEAEEDVDFVPIASTELVFQPGQTSKTVDVTILDDWDHEDTEEFLITQLTSENANVTVQTATVEIIDDDVLPPDLVPEDLCECCNSPWSVVKTSSHQPRRDSSDPVRYFDGVVKLAATDLASDGFGGLWGHNRSWSNGPGYANRNVNGNGWTAAQLPWLMSNTESVVILVTSANSAQYFDYSPSPPTYTPRHYDRTTLVHDDENDEFVFTDETGAVIRFSSRS